MCLQDPRLSREDGTGGTGGRDGAAGFATGAMAGTGLQSSGGATASEAGASSEAGQPEIGSSAGAGNEAGTDGRGSAGETSVGESGSGGRHDTDDGGHGGGTGAGRGGFGGKPSTIEGDDAGDASTPGGHAGASSGGAGASALHWVGTWTASPYYDATNQPPASLANSVLRQVVHVSLGGTTFRVQFSNLGGSGPVTINAAHVALCKASPLVDSTIDTSTDTALAFGGSAAATIAAGSELWSDPVALTVPALGNVSITTAFGSVPVAVVGHSGSRTTSYLQTASSTVNAASMKSALTFQHWYYIAGMDVVTEPSAVGVVAIGDSITDGRGTDNDGNDRWTDVLAARLAANPATAKVAMMNQGIGATNLIGSGTAAQARFKRDVLGQSGVRYAIVLDGVNDIGGGASAQALKNAYADLITRAHAANVLIYGGTITPFSGNSYYTVAHETVREDVNTYIRSGAFDGYIDFDAAVSNGGTPPQLVEAYAAWSQKDYLHPGPAGYQAMGAAAALTLFAQ
jgi:lysophospholipase L1-like esterase